MGPGSWSLTFVEETPQSVFDQLKFFGHVAFVPGRLEPGQFGDALLAQARYVGVLTGRSADLVKKIDGQGMSIWLGDSDDKGDVYESPVAITGQTFPNAIRALLSGGTAVVEGTLYSGIPGTYTGRHQWQSRRKAIDYVCSTMGAEWRVTGEGKLDAGPATSLFKSTPDCVIVRTRPNHATDGTDMSLRGLRGDMTLATDVDDYTTRVVVIAEGEGESTATGSADAPGTLYLDIRGNPINRTRLISESGTTAGNADARAALALGNLTETRNAMTLTTDDYDIRGAFQVGDWVWVWDPDAGLVDPQNEIVFRGERMNPIRLRMAGASWPVKDTMTVAYRSQSGTWIDLSPYIAHEGGETTVDVGDLLKALSDASVEPVGPRPIPDSTIPGVVAWDLPFESGVYLDGNGNTRAKMLVKWLLPLNVDGSTILDGRNYEINYAPSPAGTDWQTAFASWGTLQAMLADLSPGIDYDFRIRAVDSSDNFGAWSTVQTEQTEADTIPPSTPAPPTVAGNRLSIQITHTLGKSSGGTYNLELDLDHLEVHVGASSSFTADATTLRGKVDANAGMIQAHIPAVGTVPVEETTARFIRVIAVDQAGNRSSPSTTATTTALLIDDAHITDLTVSKVTAGTISANWLIGASIRTASSGQRVELNTSGLQMYNSAGTQLVSIAPTGVFYLRSATTAARIDISTVTGLQTYNSAGVRTTWLDVDGSFELRSAASGARIQLDGTGFAAYNSGGNQTVDIDAATGNVTVVGTIATGFSGNRIIFNPPGTPWPHIYFAPDTGTNYASIQSQPAVNGNSSFYAESSTDSSSGRKSLVSIGHEFFYAAAWKPTGNTAQSELMLAEDKIMLNWFGSSDHKLFCDNSGWKVNGVAIKSFIIDHPTDGDRYLVHACTESPHAGVEYWGETTLDDKGQAVVTLPAYFEALTKVDGRYVSVNTCSDEIRNASATYPTDGTFTIHGGAGLKVTWLVKAVRADADSMLVEPRRDQIDVHGTAPYLSYTLKDAA